MADSPGDVSMAYDGSPDIVDEDVQFGGLVGTKRANAKRMLATGRDLVKGMIPFSGIGTSEHYRDARTHYQSLEAASSPDIAIQKIFRDVQGRIMELLITEKALDETYLTLMANKAKTDASGGAELSTQKKFFDLEHAAYHKTFRRTVIWINMAQAFIYKLRGGQFDPSNPRDFQKAMADAPAPKPADTTGEMSNGMIPAVPPQTGGYDDVEIEEDEEEGDAFGYDAEGGGFFRKLMGNARDNVKQVAPVDRFYGRNKTWGDDGREITTHYGMQPNMRHDRIRLINERAYSKWSPCFPERKYVFNKNKKTGESMTVWETLYEEKVSLTGSFVQGEFEYEESRKSENGGFYTRPAKDGKPETKVSSGDIMKELSSAINDKNELFGFGWNRMCRINDEVYHLEIMGGVKAPPTMFQPQASEYLDMIATFQKKLREAGMTKKVTVRIMKDGVDTGRTRVDERDILEGYQSVIGEWTKDEYGQNELKGGFLFGKVRSDAIQVVLNTFVECFNGVQRARVIGFCPGKPVTWRGIWWFIDRFPVIGCTLKDSEGKTTKNLLNCIKLACPRCRIPWPPPNPFKDLTFCPPCECDCDAMWEAINTLEMSLWPRGDHLSGPNVDKFVKKMNAAAAQLGNMTQVPPASAGIGAAPGQATTNLPHFSGQPYLALGAPPAVDPSGLPHFSGNRPGDIQAPYLGIGQAPATAPLPQVPSAAAGIDPNRIETLPASGVPDYLVETIPFPGSAPAPQPAADLFINTAPADPTQTMVPMNAPFNSVPLPLRPASGSLRDIANAQFGGASKGSMTATTVALSATILAMAFLGAA